MRVAVFISGRGTNLQALIDHLSGSDITIELVITDSSDTAAMGLKKAEAANIPTRVINYKWYSDKAAAENKISDCVKEYDIDLIVLAGYMKILSPEFTKKWAGKLINLHPSLLPAFPGLNAIQQAYDYGVKIIGVTVHYVDEGVDTGKIIAQKCYRVREEDTIDDYEKIIHKIEHWFLPAVVKLLAEQKSKTK